MEDKDIIFEEYKSLRQESLQSMRSRNAILTFGLAVIGVIFHAGINSFSQVTTGGHWLSFFIFFIGIPTISLLILILWFGEAMRMSRVGFYLKEREDLINLLSGSVLENLKATKKEKKHYPNHFDKVIFWENYIREQTNGSSEKTRQMKFPYYAVITLFLGISISSIIISVLFPLKSLSLGTPLEVIAALVGLSAISLVASVLRKIGKTLK